jgi:hypothetical protein
MAENSTMQSNLSSKYFLDARRHPGCLGTGLVRGAPPRVVAAFPRRGRSRSGRTRATDARDRGGQVSFDIARGTAERTTKPRSSPLS